MGTIKGCLQNTLLSMNRSAEHRLGSMDAIARQLAGTVPGAPIARFKAGEQVQRNTGLSIKPQ